MTGNKKIIFYHGGPGLNSNPERNMLTPLYKNHQLELITWNEPSRLRNTLTPNAHHTTFEALLQSAENFLLEHYNGTQLILMGSSFGSQIIAWLLERHAEKIETVIFSAPCFHIYDTDRLIFNALANDYKQQGATEKAAAFENILTGLCEKFDENNAAGWQLALANPALLNFYWANKEQLQLFLSFMTEPDYTIDVENFFDIRKTMVKAIPKACDVRTIVFYGVRDVAIDLAKEIATIKNAFNNVHICKLNNAAHYPHIEQAEEVLDIIEKIVYQPVGR